MNEPGRNDPCSCGSGKKYKKCCLLTKPKPYAELEKDFQLGQQRIAEFEAERNKPKSYSPFEDSQEYHESFVWVEKESSVEATPSGIKVLYT